MKEVLVIDDMKRCSKCDEVLHVSSFQKSCSTKAGYKSACRKCRDEERRSEYEKNKELVLLRGKRWREKNKEQMNAIRRAWYENNKEKFKKIAKDWELNNKDAKRSRTRNYRARKRNANGTHSKQDIQSLLSLQKNHCAVCKTSLAKKYHVDHIIPLVAGGENSKTNLQLLCPDCNFRKNDKDPLRFMQEKGYLL